jgi:caffeoyl-CoA O-methyltransferase
MSRTTDLLGPAGARYLHDTSVIGESPVHARLRERTAELPRANMQISPEQGRLMGLLVQMLGARRAIEVGVFTGYSALCVAERLPRDGLLVACDISEEYTSIARPFWEEAGVAERIDLRLAPAADTLAALIDAGEAGTYDFAFIDADKESNESYYEQCLQLLRPGGAVAIDNVFAGGRAFDHAAAAVHDSDHADGADADALNRKLLADPRVDATLVPVSDGILLARKR